MKLYWGSGSPFAWRAMLALIVKGVAFEDELLQFSKKEHKTPDYLAINPRGKVPTLVDGDVVVTESLAIIEYIDRKIPSPPLFGESAAEAAAISQRVCEHESYLSVAALGAVRQTFRGDLQSKADSIREATQTLREEIGHAVAALGEAPWFGGAKISAADLVLFPSLSLVERVATKPEVIAADLGFPKLSDSPTLAVWHERVSAQPGFDRAYPPHWRD